MNEIKAKEGYYLSDKNKTTFFKSIVGANVNADDYIEVEATEAEGIIKHDNTIREIDTIEKVDDCVYRASLVAECMNIVPMTNKEAVSRTSLFPKWEDYVGKSFDKIGFKIQYNEKLYEVIQTVSIVLEHLTPDLVPANYVLVSEYAGTKEDPIPYEQMMIIEKYKYYTQYGKLYIGIMDANTGFPNDLKDLPTLVLEVIE